MALQNIGAANRDDAFYRYKMPKMITKIEGRGNGIKTNVVNMVEIAKALARPASYTTKYFGCELGAQSKFDEKTGTSLVNGSHETAKLAALLENFIKKYVQCYYYVDMRDKLTSFILKNPPEQKKGSKDKKAMRRAEKERLKEGEAADEEQKKLKKEAVKKKGTSGGSKDVASKASTKKKSNSSDEDHSPAHSQAGENDQADDDDDDVQWQTDTSLEAARQRIQEQLSAATAEMVMLSTDEEKQKSAKKSPAHEVKTEVNGHKDGNGLATAHGSLVDEIREYMKKGSSAGKLKPFLGSLSGTPQEVMDALFEALFEGLGKGFAKEVTKKKNYLAAATQEEGSQRFLLHAIESFCAKASPEAAKEVALVLKALYDHDVLEESSIMEWYQQGLSGGKKASQIWKNVRPVIDWLQSAESESEEE
nr:eukaryotic translation initiation factor 5 [Quercus suber]